MNLMYLFPMPFCHSRVVMSKVIRLGSDFSGLECLSWATGNLGIVNWKLLKYFELELASTWFLIISLAWTCFHHLRKCGYKHKLCFMSELDPDLRRMSAAIHEPKHVFSVSWPYCFFSKSYQPPVPWELSAHLCNQDALKRDVLAMPTVDLYGAGPPCQPVSSAGRKRGWVGGRYNSKFSVCNIFICDLLLS